MITKIKRLVRWLLNLIRDSRDYCLSLISGVYLQQLIPDAKITKPADIHMGVSLDVSEDAHTESARHPQKHQRILILVPCKDVEKFLPILESNLLGLTYPKHLLSIGFLEGDSKDNTYQALQNIKQNLSESFAEVFLLQHSFAAGEITKEELNQGELNQEEFKKVAPRDSQRWKMRKQLKRRSIIAQVRNYLLKKCLNDKHQWVLWVDSDVIHWENDCIQQLLSFNKDILVPHCVREDNGRTFDLNSFKYQDDKRRNWRTYLRDGLIQPPVGYGRLYLEDFPEHDLVSLDGLGGTMMLVKADIHRQGLIYPDYILHKHIETEALAFMARDMGYECWGTPQVTIVHPIY